MNPAPPAQVAFPGASGPRPQLLTKTWRAGLEVVAERQELLQMASRWSLTAWTWPSDVSPPDVKIQGPETEGRDFVIEQELPALGSGQCFSYNLPNGTHYFCCCF